MKYFKKVDLPVFTGAAEELYKLLESNTISWHHGQICLKTTADQPNNYKLGVGSLYLDWESNSKEKNTTGDVKLNIPIKNTFFRETDFIILCNQFKNTIFENIYNIVNKEYKIGRVRLMKSDPKTCLSWHKDSNYRLHYPIKTQDGCLMIIDDEVLHLEQSTWYLASTTKFHTALNASKESRIHLVFDII
jgi:hypothetical protein